MTEPIKEEKNEEEKEITKKRFVMPTPKHPLTVDIRGRGVGDLPYAPWENHKPIIER